MHDAKHYQVKELARLAGITVRTLHYYDEIGLLRPSARSAAGYRLYDGDDLIRLQQILIGRSLGLPLTEIQQFLDRPGFDRLAALRAQREALVEQALATDRMIRAVDKAIAGLDGSAQGDFDMKELFDGFEPAEHQAEAERRWGATDAYRESSRRTRNYTPDDWKTLKAEQDRIYADAAAAMAAGASPESAEAMAIAERHRLSIDRWFYPCSPFMHRGLADLYEADARFRENIDEHGEGLTTFLAAAIRANTDAAAGQP
ncbi:hypothetical protein ABI59_20430 [Acidobacteria bacterium Mor1]|nr:hypothetical protein ABI59_20430 [Acidobacteria bacterium Mor1]